MQPPPPVIARADRAIRRWMVDGDALVLAEAGKADRELALEPGRSRAAIDTRCGLRRTRPDCLTDP